LDSTLYIQLAGCPQCYFGEIRQMFTFLISIYCLKAYNRPDHSIRIVEYYKKGLPSLDPTSSQILEPREVFGFLTLVPVISSPKRTNFALAPYYRA
jgi:hypothetical protein